MKRERCWRYGRRSKLDGGLCLRPPFRQQAVPANRSKDLVARATQVFQHPIRTCVPSPTRDVNPRYHHPLSRPAQSHGFLRKGRLALRSAPKKRRSHSADEITETAATAKYHLPRKRWIFNIRLWSSVRSLAHQTRAIAHGQ